MEEHTMVRFSMAFLVAISMAACGGGSGDGGGETGGDDQYAGPIASNDTARGQEVFTNVCMACHSSGPALENIGWDVARLRHQVREGSGGMSPVSESRVSAEDLEAVLAYMATIGGVAGETGATDTGGGDTGGGEEEPPMDEGAPDDSGEDTGGEEDAPVPG